MTAMRQINGSRGGGSVGGVDGHLTGDGDNGQMARLVCEADGGGVGNI